VSPKVVRLAALSAAVFVARPLVCQNVHPTTPPEVTAVLLQGRIELDGRLDEPIWSTAPAATGFRQNQPRAGEPATQRTEVRFTYDNTAMYVGARMFDEAGAAGVRTRLVRRDGNIASDYVQVIFDPYHDHIGRLFLLVNPSGVRSDANGLGGGGDNSWDPVWEVKTAIDSLGWTAEMRIPFAQLRFPTTRAEQTWGLQIWRQENRLNELSQWAFWGLDEQGGPPRFGHLRGLVIERAPGRAELLPYAVGRSDDVPQSWEGRGGLDARVLLTSNLTLNATLNPDFGQVEVDPRVVNLGVFETFLEERRPFFIEGAGYFSFGGLNCFFCSNVSSLSMLGSRRMGRAPQMPGNARLHAGPGGTIAAPENTTILGAAKLTGRTPSGWSVGVLDAVTQRERGAFVTSGGAGGEVTVEPFANYFVGRVAKDLQGGATVVRGIATSVMRQLDDTFLVARLSRRSEALGLATEMWFKNRTYQLMAQVAGTQVTGDTGAIRRLQMSSARYFQRPDRDDGPMDAADARRTALRGLGAYARFAKVAGRLFWEMSHNIRTPGFENNDIAFLSQSDYWWMSANVMPQWTKPTSWYRWLQFIVGGQQKYNFDGDLTDRQVQLFGYIQPLNYWDVSAFYIHRPSLLDDRLSRGGPVLRRPGVDVWSASVTTDGRKRLVLSLGGETNRDGDGYWDRSLSLTAEYRPASNVSLSLGPSFGEFKTGVQWVATVADAAVAPVFAGNRYVFADLQQNEIGMETRLNITFSTDLTLELFVQPLISSGDYTRYKEFADARTLSRRVYGEDVGTTPVRGTGAAADSLFIDPDGGGPAAQFGVEDPNFTERSLRGNAVLRWEYRPGSTLFLVWTRSGGTTLSRGRLDFSDDVRGLFEGASQNVFLIKASFWLGM
jgi:hypothetical protein